MELDAHARAGRPEAFPSAAGPFARVERRPGLQDGGEPVVEVVRVVGPGRIERRYQDAIAALEGNLAARERDLADLGTDLAALGSDLAALGTDLAARDRELAAAELVERGSRARLDRLERETEDLSGELARSREREREHEAEARRMCAALGALARENELLREAHERRATALAGPPRGLGAPKLAPGTAGVRRSVAPAAARRAGREATPGFFARLFGRGRDHPDA